MAGYRVKCVYLNAFNMKNNAILLFYLNFGISEKAMLCFKDPKIRPLFLLVLRCRLACIGYITNGRR